MEFFSVITVDVSLQRKAETWFESITETGSLLCFCLAPLHHGMFLQVLAYFNAFLFVAWRLLKLTLSNTIINITKSQNPVTNHSDCYCSNHGNQKLSILKELSVWPNNCKRLKWSRQQRTNRTGRHTNTGINTDIPRLGWGPYQCLFGVQYLV